MKRTTSQAKPQAILTMGLPGAGKSTALGRMKLDGFRVIDPDAAKERHPEYDPTNPTALHEWSKRVSEAEIAAAVADQADVVIDGTGTNAEKMVRRTLDLQAAGYHVTILYVAVKLSTALARNAARDRTVPEEIVREKASLISTSFEILSRYADEMKTVQND